MRRPFEVVWDPLGALDLLQARAFLGPSRAADLDDELERVRARLQILPQSGHPVRTRRAWFVTVRRVILDDAPYHLYYRLNVAEEQIVIFALRHERRRPPRF